MLYLIFQILDVLTIGALIGGHFEMLSWKILMYHAAYLIIKGGVYWKSWMSWLDIVVGVTLIFMIFDVRGWMSWFSVGYMAFKIINSWAAAS